MLNYHTCRIQFLSQWCYLCGYAIKLQYHWNKFGIFLKFGINMLALFSAFVLYFMEILVVLVDRFRSCWLYNLFRKHFSVQRFANESWTLPHLLDGLYFQYTDSTLNVRVFVFQGAIKLSNHVVKWAISFSFPRLLLNRGSEPFYLISNKNSELI